MVKEDMVVCTSCCEDVKETECRYTHDGWVCDFCDDSDYVCSGWSTN